MPNIMLPVRDKFNNTSLNIHINYKMVNIYFFNNISGDYEHTGSGGIYMRTVQIITELRKQKYNKHNASLINSQKQQQ